MLLCPDREKGRSLTPGKRVGHVRFTPLPKLARTSTICQDWPIRVHVLGPRGSTPAPGNEFSRYGGHTACVAIAHDGHPPSLIIDAGTGIRSLSPLLEHRPFRGTILLGHLHWDHTQGLPFFKSGNDPGARVDLWGPAQVRPGGGVDDFEGVLSRAMSPPHFPIGPRELRGEWAFAGIEEGEHETAGFSVRALQIPHSGGRTFGYRVTDGQSTLAYISDHYPLHLGPGEDGLGLRHPNALNLAHRADLMLHDAQYLDEELPERAHFGHSSAGYAVGLARAAGARHVLFYHHDPDRTDAEVDAMLARYQRHPDEAGISQASGFKVGAAAQGDIFDLVGSAGVTQ